MKIESIVQPINHNLRQDDSLTKVARLLEAEGIAALPVMNHDGSLLGLITAQDVVAANADATASAEARVISELVRPWGVTCNLTDDVEPLANQARSKSQTHVAVVDDLGTFVGIADLSPYLRTPSEIQHREEALDEALDETFPASDPIPPP